MQIFVWYECSVPCGCWSYYPAYEVHWTASITSCCCCVEIDQIFSNCNFSRPMVLVDDQPYGSIRLMVHLYRSESESETSLQNGLQPNFRATSLSLAAKIKENFRFRSYINAALNANDAKLLNRAYHYGCHTTDCQQVTSIILSTTMNVW